MPDEIAGDLVRFSARPENRSAVPSFNGQHRPPSRRSTFSYPDSARWLDRSLVGWHYPIDVEPVGPAPLSPPPHQPSRPVIDKRQETMMEALGEEDHRPTAGQCTVEPPRCTGRRKRHFGRSSDWDELPRTSEAGDRPPVLAKERGGVVVERPYRGEVPGSPRRDELSAKCVQQGAYECHKVPVFAPVKTWRPHLCIRGQVRVEDWREPDQTRRRVRERLWNDDEHLMAPA